MEQYLNKVSRRFAFSDREFRIFAMTAPYRYKTYQIDKRNGGKRTISQPSKDLKVIQKYILSDFLDEQFEYHECATAYRKNRNITDNAKPHLNNSYLLKMDFKDFFPSIMGGDFERYLLDRKILDSKDEATLMTMIFFKYTYDNLSLSIGSPGSPSISNTLMYDFDSAIYKLCLQNSITYTRYSDDMTFSSNEKNVLFEIPKLVEQVLADENYLNLSINQEKTVFSSKKFNRHITGITLTNEGTMSIGYANKRKLRSQVYAAAELDLEHLVKLRGYLSFVSQIEPELVSKITNKYPKQMKLIKAAR